MIRIDQHFSQVSATWGNLRGLPRWARFLVTLAAMPGIVLIALSILAFLVSLLALLLVTVPVYRLLRAITAGPFAPADVSQVMPGPMNEPRTGRRHVDVKVVE